MRAILPLLALLLLSAELSAQLVTGRLREEDSGRPIEGAVVALLDRSGTQRSGTLTDAGGRFTLRAPAPGAYRLRAERIGFRSTLSPPLSLAAGDTLEHDLAAPTDAVRLDAVEVASERRCVLRPAEGMQAATLWEEARKALNAAALTQDQELVRFRIRRYERELDAQFLRVRGEEVVSRTHLGSRPFESLPADDLARDGYVREDGDSWIYYAPDAHVLLSDPFLDTHCFRVRRGEGPTRGLIGLGFEPLRSHRLPDIEGVLWLDARTAELRFVEFDYTRIPLRRDAAQGGRVEYQRLPGGAWIVSRWWIRMPLLSRSAVGNEVTLLAVTETGGEVDEIVGAGGGPTAAADRPRLSGTVYDSTAAAPLAGATVYLSGTSYSAVTDASGVFRLDSAPEGEFTLGVIHPRLDSLDIPSPSREVTLAPGQSATVELAIPPLPALMARACAARAPEGTGLVLGVVADERTGVSLPGAQVTLSWTDPATGEIRQQTRTSDADGRFRLCGAPLETPVRARALLLRRRSAEQEVRLAGGDPAQLTLSLPLGQRPPDHASRRITFGPGAPAALQGRVLGRDGGPVAGAVVRLEGTDARATSDAEGRFELSGLAADAYVLTVEHASEGRARHVVELTAGSNRADVRLGSDSPR